MIVRVRPFCADIDLFFLQRSSVHLGDCDLTRKKRFRCMSSLRHSLDLSLLDCFLFLKFKDEVFKNFKSFKNYSKQKDHFGAIDSIRVAVTENVKDIPETDV